MFLGYDAQGSDGSTKIAIYTSGGYQVKVAANEADKPAEQAAAIAALNTAQSGKPVQQYATAFLGQRGKILNAFVTFHEGFRTAPQPPALADYRTALSQTFTVLNALPASFNTELTQERTALSCADPATVGTFTLAQCQAWHQLLSGWLGRAMAGVACAMVGQLD